MLTREIIKDKPSGLKGCHYAILPNGIRVVTEQVNYVHSVSIGLWVGAGSKDEPPELSGLSHFIEHLFFKGTKRKDAFKLVDAIESIGGYLNAFTDKEYTCFYAKVPYKYYKVALEILADMLLHPRLHTDDIRIEKQVVLDEIRRHQDTPEELIFDLTAKTIWKNHPLGNPILGNLQSLMSFRKYHVLKYLKQFYTPDNIVIAAAGRLNPYKFIDGVAHTFGTARGKKQEIVDPPPQINNEFSYLQKETKQLQMCLCTPGYPISDRRKFTLSLIDCILGQGMSSKLFQEIREKRGLVYSIDTSTASYKAAGIFVVVFSSSPKNVLPVIKLIKRQLTHLKLKGLNRRDLRRAKEQLKGELLLAMESTDARMSRLAKNILYFDRVVPLNEVIENIEQVSCSDVTEVAEELFQPENYNLAIIGKLTKGLIRDIKSEIWS